MPILIVLVGVTVHKTSLDGLDGLFWSLLFEEDTRYAPGYSEAGFYKIKHGMTEAEVKRLLGEPLMVDPPDSRRNYTYWRYSESPKDTHYRQRFIRFQNGIVTERISEFYVD